VRILVTGGAGFIGSALVRRLIEQQHNVCTLDKLGYAGSLKNIADVMDNPAHRFVEADIANETAVDAAFANFKPEAVMHLAAETHVDRSVDSPRAFIDANVFGTYALLEAGLKAHAENPAFRMLHVSTDEVFGTLGPTGAFKETSPYQPNSPYSASKAAADHLARAWWETYRLPVIVTNCSNNYGPYQHPEKLIPTIIRKALADQPIPVYGDGLQVRDWLHVDDHIRGLSMALVKGEPGESYNIGADNERTNIEIVGLVLDAIARLKKRDRQQLESLISFVTDRPGHDRRYAVDASHIKQKLNWRAEVDFVQGIADTVAWYAANEDWSQEVAAHADGKRLGLGRDKQ